MNEPQHSEKATDTTPMLRAISNTSKDLLLEIATKSTKSLLNLGDELSVNPQKMSIYLKKLGFPDRIVDRAIKIGNKIFLKPENMAKYLKKMGFSDGIVDGAMRQAGFAGEIPEIPKAPKEEV